MRTLILIVIAAALFAGTARADRTAPVDRTELPRPIVIDIDRDWIPERTAEIAERSKKRTAAMKALTDKTRGRLKNLQNRISSSRYSSTESRQAREEMLELFRKRNRESMRFVKEANAETKELMRLHEKLKAKPIIVQGP